MATDFGCAAPVIRWVIKRTAALEGPLRLGQSRGGPGQRSGASQLGYSLRYSEDYRRGRRGVKGVCRSRVLLDDSPVPGNRPGLVGL